MAAAIGLLLPLLLAEVVLRFLPVMSGLYATRTDAAHPLIHFEPNHRFTYSLGPTFSVAVRGRVNNAGWVNDQDYDSAATSPLLAVVGDSYVEALMVPYRETLQGRLATAAAGRGRVYSFGTSGAPLAHYLMIADHARAAYRPQGMVVVVVGNDFDESLRRYKVAPGLYGFAEDPGQRLVLERADYLPNRWKRLLRRSALVRYVHGNLNLGALRAALRPGPAAAPASFAGNVAAHADSARLADSRRVVDEFLRQLPGRSGLAPARVALVVDAVRPQLYDPRAIAAADSSYFGRMRQYLMTEARRAGYEVVDLQPLFLARYAREHQPFEFRNDGHWSGRGHEVAADAVRRGALFATLFGSPPAAR